MIKWAATDIAPVMQAAGRSGISALLVGLLICWKGGWDQVGTTWRGGLLAGALFGLEFFFISEGLQLTTAAHMADLFWVGLTGVQQASGVSAQPFVNHRT